MSAPRAGIALGAIGIACLFAAQLAGQGQVAPQAQGSTYQSLQSANQLIGIPVTDQSGSQVGQVEELVLDLGQQRVALAIISLGQQQQAFGQQQQAFGQQQQQGGGQQQMTAVPWELCNLSPNARQLRCRVSQQQIQQAPSFTPSQAVDMRPAEWISLAQQIRQHYGTGMQQGGQQQYGQQQRFQQPGYVPPQQQQQFGQQPQWQQQGQADPQQIRQQIQQLQQQARQVRRQARDPQPRQQAQRVERQAEQLQQRLQRAQQQPHGQQQQALQRVQQQIQQAQQQIQQAQQQIQQAQQQAFQQPGYVPPQQQQQYGQADPQQLRQQIQQLQQQARQAQQQAQSQQAQQQVQQAQRQLQQAQQELQRAQQQPHGQQQQALQRVQQQIQQAQQQIQHAQQQAFQQQYGQQPQWQQQGQKMGKPHHGGQMMGRQQQLGPVARRMVSQLGDRFITAHTLSGLVGMQVFATEEREQLGEIEDLVIEPQSGTVAFGILSPGQGDKAERRLVAGPWNALQINERQRVARLDADQQTLDQLAFRVGEYPDLTDPSYVSRLYEQFGAPQQQAFGFVPEERPVSQEPGWQTESEYNKQFRENQVESIRGRVESTGIFYPDEQAETPGLRLKVQTEDGELRTVHAGPVALAAQQGVRFHFGQPVEVTGSETQIDERPVILAAEIRSQGQTLQIRSEKGEPRWQQQIQQQGQQQYGQPRWQQQRQQKQLFERRQRQWERDQQRFQREQPRWQQRRQQESPEPYGPQSQGERPGQEQRFEREATEQRYRQQGNGFQQREPQRRY